MSLEEQTKTVSPGEPPRPLPDTVYFQIDGGSENTAKAAIAICELLVARRVVKKLVLSRLPPGHTHEDIDQLFSIIWRHIQRRFVHTPQQYKENIKIALGQQCEVHDIFVVPDYESFVRPFIDPKFSRYAKGEWTQLQFTFESVPISNYFPLGVKTSYRQYCQDSVNRIVFDSQSRCGMIDDRLLFILCS